MTAETLSTRARLEAFREQRRELNMQTLRLRQMRDNIGDVKSPDLEAKPKVMSFGDATTRKVIALQELAEVVEDLTIRDHDEHEALEAIIKHVYRADQRFVLRMRYFDLLEWPDIAFALYGDRADYLTGEKEYINHLYRIHTKAIRSMTAARRAMTCRT